MLRILNNRKKKGFTLIELIVVIVILAILAVVGLNAMNGFIARANRARILANGRSVYLAGLAVGQDKIAAAGGSDLSGNYTVSTADLEGILGAGFMTGKTAAVVVDTGGNVLGDGSGGNSFKYTETVNGVSYTVSKPAAAGSGFVITP